MPVSKAWLLPGVESDPYGLSANVRYWHLADSFRRRTACRDPECDLARVLKDRGYSGTVALRDGTTGRLRTLIRIAKAARVTAEEGPNGPRFVKYRGQTVGANPYRPKTGLLDSPIAIATSS